MKNIWNNLYDLAKSVQYQNLFTISKEIYGIKLFENSNDLSNIQNIFLSYLYSIDSINKDIIVEKISEHVLDNQIYYNSYLMWKKEKKYKQETKDNSKKDLKLVCGKEIKFPQRT